MKKLFRQSYNRGLTLGEILIAGAIIAATAVTVFAAFSGVVKYAEQNTALVKAGYLAEEGIEALRMMRDSGWTTNIASLTTGSTYRLAWSGSQFVATTTNSFIDKQFDRTVVLSSVGRDSNYNIVTSGGTTDTGTRKATVTVSWKNGSATISQSIETYIFNTFSN